MYPINRVELFNELTKDELNSFNYEKVKNVLGENYTTFQDICQFLTLHKEKVRDISCILESDELIFTCTDSRGRKQCIRSGHN